MAFGVAQGQPILADQHDESVTVVDSRLNYLSKVVPGWMSSTSKKISSSPKRFASPKISEKPDPKRASGARVAFSTSSQPILLPNRTEVPA